MDIFVARQAIYDRNRNIYAYELLYRNSNKNIFDASINSQSATYEVINNITLIGLDILTNNKKAFINCDEVVLGSEAVTLLSKENTVVEILETVTQNDEVIKNINNLKEMGYELALDDVVDIANIEQFIPYSKYIKVDFLLTKKEERVKLVEKLKKYDVMLLAEKIENEEEFQEAIDLGFELFQGYYFSKPKIIKNKKLEIKSNLVYVLISELNKPDFDIETIEKYLKTDVGLMYRFMRFINSAGFGFVQEIVSIRQALMLVGKIQFKKWLLVLGFSRLYDGPGEGYAALSLVRAKFCEAIAAENGDTDKQAEAFIVGIFSDLHIALGEDIDIVLKDLPVSREIKEALKGESNYLRIILDIVLAYEKMDIKSIELLSYAMNINTDKLKDLYFDAIEWAKKIEIK